MKNLNSYLDRLTSMRMRPEVLQHAVDILKAVPQIQTEVWLKMVPLDLWMRS